MDCEGRDNKNHPVVLLNNNIGLKVPIYYPTIGSGHFTIPPMCERSLKMNLARPYETFGTPKYVIVFRLMELAHSGWLRALLHFFSFLIHFFRNAVDR